MPASPDLALSFGVAAAEYDRVRPDYPPAAVELAARGLGLGRDAAVVDLAAGTGKLTRVLAGRFDGVVAIEPDERMRALLGVEAHAGTAERIPLPDGSADAVFVADAFHWFDAPAALREIARVLRPGGGLVLLWNYWWETEPPIPDAALELLRVPFECSGRAAAMAAEADWRDTFAGSPFGPLEEERLERVEPLSADDLVALYLTTSSLAALPEGERDALRAALLRSLAGPFRLTVTTEVSWTRATGRLFGKESVSSGFR